MKTVVSSVVIKNGNLLLVRKKDAWIFPGGKLEVGEGDLECLSREFGEELSGTKIKNERFYMEFLDITPHERDVDKFRIYFSEIDGDLYGIRKEDSIVESKWVKDFLGYNLSNASSRVISSLKKDGYLE